MALCFQHIDSTTNPIDYCVAGSITETQMAPLSHFDGMGQDFGDEVGQVVGAVLPTSPRVQ